MERSKFCCDGQHATMFVPLWPVIKKKIKWYTAVYQCKKCKEFSIRGETNQKTSWKTFVKFISKKRALELKAQKESNHVNDLEKSIDGGVQ